MAFAWQPLAWELARRQGASGQVFTMNACKPVLGVGGIPGQPCIDWNRQVLAQVRMMDTVVLVGRWQSASARPAVRAGLRATLDGLRGVRRVVLIGPTPELREAAPSCLDGTDLSRCAISRAEFSRQSEVDRTFMRSIATKYANVEYLDAGEWFCDPLECRATRNGVVLYWDNAHVSSSAARAFASDFH
jgi:hypothetical protein